MSNDVQFRHARRSLPLLVLAVVCLASVARAQDDKQQPLFHDYKGVSIGMAAADARQKLGNPADKSDAQDLYSINDKENVIVYYDGNKVSAIAIMFMGSVADAPTPKSIFGEDVAAKPDGSISKMVRYEKAGYFVAYSRTPGDTPMVTITMQKLR